MIVQDRMNGRSGLQNTMTLSCFAEFPIHWSVQKRIKFYFLGHGGHPELEFNITDLTSAQAEALVAFLRTEYVESGAVAWLVQHLERQPKAIKPEPPKTKGISD
jgi:hypothetical protein